MPKQTNNLKTVADVVTKKKPWNQRITSPLQVFNAIGLEETTFDPQRKIELNEMAKYRIFSNGPTGITEDDIKNSTLIEMIEDVLIRDEFNFINHKILLSSDYLLEKLEKITTYIHDNYAAQDDSYKEQKWDQVEALVLQMIALRLYKEIIY